MDPIQFLLQNYGLTGLIVGLIVVALYRQHNLSIARQKREQERYDALAKRAEEMENRLIAEMQSSLAERDKRIQVLGKRGAAVRRRANEAEKERQRLDREMIELRTGTDQRIRQMEHELGETKVLYETEQRHAKNLEAINNRLVFDNQHLLKSQEKMADELDTLRSANRDLNDTIAQMKTEFGQQINELKNGIGDLQTLLQQRDELIAQMQHPVEA